MNSHEIEAHIQTQGLSHLVIWRPASDGQCLIAVRLILGMGLMGLWGRVLMSLVTVNIKLYEVIKHHMSGVDAFFHQI